MKPAEAACSRKIRTDLPDLCYEGQEQHDGRADQVEPDQERPARQPCGKRRRHRGEGNIGDHLDRKSGAQNQPRILSGKLPCQKAQCHGGEPGADQRDDLRRIEVTEGPVLQDLEHVQPTPLSRLCSVWDHNQH